MKVSIRTYGCQMNVRDSEAMGVLLRSRGHELVNQDADADAIVVNTCSVRKKAEEKALGTLGQLVSAGKRSGRRVFVGAVGCMAQRMGDELVGQAGGLDFVIGTHRLASLPTVLDALLAGEGPVVDTGERHPGDEPSRGHEQGQVTAFVTVLEGCNRQCSYCIVPTVRGREVSRAVIDVLQEVRSLAEQGVREVTLIGQSVTSYGKTGAHVVAGLGQSSLGLREPFPRLLESVAAVPGIVRIRFASSHPSGCTDDLAKVMAAEPKVCAHLHLPVQSGSDRILALMRRGYSAGEYREVIAKFRQAIPGLAVTTDFIVGYPGETEDDFEDTRMLMRDVAFDNAFVFKYSPRPGTPASKGPDEVPYSDKVRRNRLLLADQQVAGIEINRRLEGTLQSVLVEGVSPRNEARWIGRTGSNKIVIFEKTTGTKPGDVVSVRIEQARPQTLHGRVE